MLDRREWSSAKLQPGSASHKLAVILEGRKLGARSLAKLIAGNPADPSSVEDARRNVRRWLTGTEPSRASRRTVVVALGLDEKALDPDDEEESLTSALFREMREARERFEQIESLIAERSA